MSAPHSITDLHGSDDVSLAQQAEEAELEALEYERLIRQLGITRDPKARRSAEHIRLMQFRLARKQALAATLKRLASQSANRRVPGGPEDGS